MIKQEFYKEKRKFKRLKKEVDVIYMQPLTFTIEKLKSKTLNLGGGGVCLESDRMLDVQTVLVLQIELSMKNGNQEILRTLGQVVWNKKSVNNNYVVGIKYVLEDDAVKKIRDFLEMEYRHEQECNSNPEF